MIKRRKILVIGDLMLDRYWMGRVDRISPEAPVPVVDIDTSFDKPGGAANVAQNLSVFGMDVMLVGLVGDDEASDSLNSLLTGSNIVYHPIIDNSIRTTLKLRVIDRNQQLVRIDHEDKYASKMMGKSLPEIKNYLEECDGVIISDYDKGVVKPIIKKVIAHANKIGIRTFVDPKGDDFTYYKNATLVKPNLSEFEIIMNRSSSKKEFLSKGERLRKKLNTDHLLITTGKDGMTLFSDKKNISYNTIKQDVFDVTGAGDTVISILSACMISGKTISQSVKLSNVAASLSVQKLGSTSVGQSELFDAIKD